MSFIRNCYIYFSIREEVESMDVDPSPAATESPDPDKTSEKV